MENKRKAVIFDMDGVIVDNHYYHVQAWKTFAKKHNISISDDEITEKFGGINREIIPEILGNEYSEGEINEMANEKERIYREIYDPDIHEIEGLTNLLEQLKKEGFELAVATSAPTENSDFVLDRLNIRRFFTLITTAADITHGKPDPEIYRLTADRLKISPSDCIVFEDSVRGIQSALSAGMKVIGITTTNPAHIIREANLIIDSYSDITPDKLCELLKKLS